MAELALNVHIGKIWRALGSVNLAVPILFLLAADTGIGFFTLRSGDNPFRYFNDSGLVEWTRTYGLHRQAETWWFFLLLILLFLLALNTFVCTTNRVAAIFRTHRALGLSRLPFVLSPHVMHYALIVILLGFLSSTLFADVFPNNPLVPGKAVRLSPTDYFVSLEALHVDYYQGERLAAWRKRALNAHAMLQFTSGSGAMVHRCEVSINRPARFHGFSVHLKDFGPQYEGGGMSRRPYVNLTIKRDPGLSLYFTGTGLFVAGLALYLIEWFRSRKKREEKP